MTRADLLKISLVLVILCPLVIVQGAPHLAPAWFGGSLLEIPAAVCATSLWFVVMMVLAWRFAAAATAHAADHGTK